MSFVRPEARAWLGRWREAVIGAGLAALGLWGAASSFGLTRWLAVVLALAGLTLAWSGLQRGRFRAGRGGLGVVEIDEGQIAYFAPVGGGFAERDRLTRIEIAPDRAGLPVWRFWMGGEALVVPVRAEGAEALFDLIAALPGARLEAAIRAQRTRPRAPVVIWQAREQTTHLRLT